MANDEGNKLWNLNNIIIIAMAGLISTLILVGFNSTNNKIESGDVTIHARITALGNELNSKLTDMKSDVRSINECVMRMREDITRIDTLQKIRLEQERENRGKRKPR